MGESISPIDVIMTIDYELFTQTLKFYLLKHPTIVNEDLIRYWFLCIHSEEPRIEVAYNPSKKTKHFLSISESFKNYFTSKKACADLYYEKTDTVIEFKFHRKTDNSNNCTTTKFGMAFGDLNRLSALSCTEKMFVYIFDDGMKKYFENETVDKRDNERYYFDLTTLKYRRRFKIGKTCRLQKHLSTTFCCNAFSSFGDSINDFSMFNYTIHLKYAKKIPSVPYYIVVYSVRP